MARIDAPPPGWYPDPRGGARLRWWHGTDWSDRYRPPPSPAELQRTAASRQPAAAASPNGLGAGRDHRSIPRNEIDEIIAQARSVARGEVNRAAEEFKQRTRAAARQFQPLVSEYTNRLIRWLRIALVVLVLLVIAWFVFEAVAQATFFQWLGDRIDNLTE